MSDRRSPALHLLGALLALVLLAAPAVAAASRGGAAGGELPWPDRRFAPCGALDPAGDVLYAFGGRADDASTHLGDLWALRLGSGTARPAWSQLSATGSPGAPPPVRTCSAAWDAASGRLLVFGGWNGVTHAAGVRAFDAATGQWQVLCDTSSCGAGPAARRASQIVVDEARHRLLVLGGTNGTYFDDLWSLSLDALTWERLEPPGERPVSRGGHGVAIDPTRNALYLVGGTRPGTDLDDVWRLDLATTTWTRLLPDCAPGCPAPGSGALLARDDANDRLVMYGGWDSAANVYERHAWALEDLDATPTWRQLEPSSESPQARFYPIGGYDPVGDQLVVFGGGSAGAAYKDAFGLALPDDGTPPAWHTLSPSTPLTGRDQAALVLDDGVLTTFGGFGSGTFPGTVDAGTHLADTWQRAAYRRGNWILATPADERQVPVTREGAAYALDARGDRLLLFGGLTGDTTLADVWSVDLRRPGRPRWTQLCAPGECGDGPAPRWGAHAVHDPAGNRLVVFGGLTDDGVALDDVWTLDLAAASAGRPAWTVLQPTGPRPAGRWSGATGFDPVRRRLVVFGGQTGPDAAGVPLDDTWALSLGATPSWTRLGVDGPRPAPRRSPAATVRHTHGAPSLIVATGLTATTGTHHNDVWSLDLGDDTATWQQLEADGDATAPSPRRSASAVHDARHDRLLLTFGRDGSTFFADTWSYDLATGNWARLPG